MLPIERQSFIIAKLSEEESVRTTDLATTLEVTDETVRKDLESLEQRGELLRIHGGAVRPNQSRVELALNERKQVNRDAKTAIARLAAKQIEPNDTIFIDASSTALTLVEHLPGFHLTVLTNAHNVITALADREGIDIVCTGGIYEPRSRSYIGLPAESTMRKHNIHKMFFSCNGIHLERGISETNSRQASFKERVIECSENVFCLADSTKIGLKSSFFFAEISELTTVITNEDSDPGFIAALTNQQIEVLKA
ncbi:MAG: DeoR family transcriptional regulator [Roseibacillus sp.]|nr:DeoR family transcriptional regulator [Roseibacillus sp.]HAO95489.1 DeoR/GlpR transcriptional regulator [Verrucomicrobiales bacterium]